MLGIVTAPQSVSPPRPSDRAHATAASVRALVERLELGAEVERARDACTAVRWHEGLRRRTAEIAAESRVRGAWASARLDGARGGVDEVRDLMLGSPAQVGGSAAIHEVVHGAVRATAAADALRGQRIGSGQLLARLHSAAVGTVPQAGRPRAGVEESREFPELGEPLAVDQLAARLSAVGDLIAARALAPGVVVGAIAHAELVLIRPFADGNGLVARAVERFVVHDAGVDPTGVVAPELGHLAVGMTGYHGALAGYASGSPEGVALWVRHCCQALTAAAVEAGRVADAVRRGTLAGSELEK